MVHTGAKRAPGGVQVGLVREAYHGPGVNREPTQPAQSEIATHPLRPIMLLVGFILLTLSGRFTAPESAYISSCDSLCPCLAPFLFPPLWSSAFTPSGLLASVLREGSPHPVAEEGKVGHPIGWWQGRLLPRQNGALPESVFPLPTPRQILP